MSEIRTVTIEGKPFHVEMEAVTGSEETGPDAHERIASAFDRARETAVTVAGSMASAIRTMDEALTPDEFELDFGIKFKVDGRVVVASVGSESTLTVKMHYRQNK